MGYVVLDSVSLRSPFASRSGTKQRKNTRTAPQGGNGAMKLDYPKRTARWSLAALTLLLVHSLSAPQVAHAGCSHGVVSQSDPLQSLLLEGSLASGVLSYSVSEAEVPPASRPPGPSRRLPCFGPTCSDHAPMPVSTASQGSEGPSEWGAMNKSLLDPILSSLEETLHDPPRHSIKLKVAIFHPPPA